MGKSLPEGYPSHPPPHCGWIWRLLHLEKTPKWLVGHQIHPPDWDAEKREGGEKLHFFNNIITKQYFDTLLSHKDVYSFSLLIGLTNCAHLLSACLASENGVLYSEGRVYKRAPELIASPVDCTPFYRQHLCEEQGTQERSRPQQHTWKRKPLLFFLLNYCCT